MGSTVRCLHDYLATFKIATCSEQGHAIPDMLFAETTASETKRFLCCPEAGASKAGLVEKNKKQPTGKTRVKKSTSQTSVLQGACTLLIEDHCCSTAGKTKELCKALLAALAITPCFLVNQFPNVHQPMF